MAAKSNTDLTTKIKENKNGAPSVANQVRGYLEKMKSEIAMALPKHCTPDRMARMALTEIRSTPALLKCSIESLMAGVMKASQEGLEFGTNRCYLVPYWNKKKQMHEATYIRGYLGAVDLVRRTGELVSIGADFVCVNDDYEFEKGFEPKCRHVPRYGNRGDLLGFYAYAVLKDGGKQADFMTLEEVEAIRQRSKAKDSGPWVTDYNEMGKKTVLRRLCKLLPLSIEVQQALQEDTEREFGASAIEINLGDELDQDPETPNADSPASDDAEPPPGGGVSGSSDEEFTADVEAQIRQAEMEEFGGAA